MGRARVEIEFDHPEEHPKDKQALRDVMQGVANNFHATWPRHKIRSVVVENKNWRMEIEYKDREEGQNGDPRTP